MGGFDFTLTQRYPLPQAAIPFSKAKTSSPSRIKRQAPRSWVSSSRTVSCWQPTPEPQGVLSWSRRTAKRSTMSHPTSTHVEPELLPTPSLLISSNLPTSNCKDSTQEDRQESAHISHPPASYFIGTKDILAHTSSSEATTPSDHTLSCSAQRASMHQSTQLLLPTLCHHGIRITARPHHHGNAVQG